MKKSIISKLFATMALAVTCLSVRAAAPEAGKVYRIRNVAYDKVLCDNGPTASLGCTALNTDSKSQLWLAETASTSGALTFRSLGTGMYMRSSSARSAGWTLASAATNRSTHMMVNADGNSFTIWASGGNTYLAMHCDGQFTVVCWDATPNTSHWDFQAVSMTQAEIDEALNANKDIFAEAEKEGEYQTALDALFADKACTQLKSNYASMSIANIQKDANYLKLPAVLRKMVEKVRGGDWTEVYANRDNLEWDSEHAKKFRVQNYEPYSSGNDAAQLAGIQAYTNMNNPTGILSDSGSLLYVMVDKAPAEGSQIFMNGAVGLGMFNDYTAGVELHEGLNIVPGWTDQAHQFIYYTVATVDWVDGKPVRSQHKLSAFSPIKIHIEGGEINGFFDYRGDEAGGYAPDTNDDFLYYRERARHEMFDFIGQYVILHFFFPDTPFKAGEAPGRCVKSLITPNQRDWDLVNTMKTWDQLCFAERLIMGLQKDDDIVNDPRALAPYLYDGAGASKFNPYEPLTGDDVAPNDLYEYFNNRMMGITMQGDLFMNATTWRTAYNGSTINSLLRTISTNSGDLWGPAHEYGHMNQGPMKVAGTTEISNNVFSNVAVYYQGLQTSRADFPSAQLNIFNKGLTYLENGTWGTTRMYFQLWCYYHAAGHNKKFFPRLYELLRRNPLQHSYYLNARYDMLHFAKMCCIAAGEDLTDFFESWGFFVPLDNYHIGDYANYMCTLTQEDIDAVKQEIAALNLPKNRQIILIDDRPGSTRDSWWGWDKENCGSMGSIPDFRNGCQPTGTLSFNINGFTVEVDSTAGTGGVGFLVYDADDNLLAFSNDYSFPINSKAAAALIAGTAQVYAIGSDGTKQTVTNNFTSADGPTRLAELQKLIAIAEPELAKVDPTNTKIGYYMEFYSKKLAASVEAAKKMTAENTADEIADSYLDLINEYNALMHHEFASVRFIPGSTYTITSKKWDTRALREHPSKLGTLNNGLVRDGVYDTSFQWVFETVDADANKYRIKNVATGHYITTTEKKGTTPKLGTKAQACTFNVVEDGRGEYVIYQEDNNSMALHINTDGDAKAVPPIIVESHWEGSHWTLGLISAAGRGGAQARLKQIVAEAKSIMPMGGSVSVDGTPIELSADRITTNAPYNGDNEADRFTSFDVLLDGDTKTYFHSDYAAGAPTTNHRLEIDLGEGNETQSFQVIWTTRNLDGSNANTNAPVTVRVYGSNDGEDFSKHLLATLNDCPTGSAVSFLSPVIESDVPYRYLRLSVTKTSTGAKFFVLSELGINNAKMKVLLNEKYPAVTEQMMLNVYNALTNAESILKSNDGNPTEVRCNEAYDELYPAYEALARALGVEVFSSIEEIEVGENAANAAAEGIYDLYGRRYNEIPGPGIFIVNGRKVLVK